METKENQIDNNEFYCHNYKIGDRHSCNIQCGYCLEFKKNK